MQRYFVLYCPNEIDGVAWTAQATIPPHIKTVSGIAVLPLGKSYKDYQGKRREHTNNGTPANPSNPPSPTPTPSNPSEPTDVAHTIPGQGFGPVKGPNSPAVEETEHSFSCVYPITVTLNGGEPIFEGFPVDKRRQGRVRFEDMFVEIDEPLPLNSTITVSQSYAYLKPAAPASLYIPLPFPYGKILDDLPFDTNTPCLIKPVTGVEIIVRYEA